MSVTGTGGIPNFYPTAYKDTRLPSARWIGQGKATGDGSGGSVSAQMNLIPIAKAVAGSVWTLDGLGLVANTGSDVTLDGLPLRLLISGSHGLSGGESMTLEGCMELEAQANLARTLARSRDLGWAEHLPFLLQERGTTMAVIAFWPLNVNAADYYLTCWGHVWENPGSSGLWRPQWGSVPSP